MKTRKIAERTNKSTDEASVVHQIGVALGENPLLAVATGVVGFALAAKKETGIIGTIAGMATILGATHCFDKAVKDGYLKHNGHPTVRKHLRKFLIEKCGATPFTDE